MELPNGIFTTSTLSGQTVVLYTLRAGGERPIHGAYYNRVEWIPVAWTKRGKIDDDTSTWLDIVVPDELFHAIQAETQETTFAPNP
jgi:hypothetical protein